MVMPSKTNETIVVRIEDKLLVWTDGHLGGDKELVKEAKLLSDLKVKLFPMNAKQFVVANVDDVNDRVGAVAAMTGVGKGRFVILQLDDETYNKIFYKPEPESDFEDNDDDDDE